MLNDLVNKCEIFYKLARTQQYHTRRSKLIEELGGKCITCGSKDNLQFDHKDRRKKKMRMADLHSVSDAVLREELKNIQLLCRDCHKNKSHAAWDWASPKPRHGTFWMYRKHKCRCDECIEAFRESHKRWNQTRSDRRKE